MILEKFNIQYYRCKSCGFVQTEEPFWLNESYSDVINMSDVGHVSRNTQLARLTSSIFSYFSDADGTFVDYGGGYGLLVRLMRDAGFNFLYYDKHCRNLFARGFEACTANLGRCEAVTAFEVFEHFVNPMEEIEQMLAYSNQILFTTVLIPATLPHPGKWWYYGTEHGQHISLYTLNSLEVIAQKFSLFLHTNGSSLHLLTSKRVPQVLFRCLASGKVATLINVFNMRKSLLSGDYKKITGIDMNKC